MTPCAPNFPQKKIKLNMRDELLTRNECEAMRGIAIIGIFLHNYCHWLNPVVKENEYQFFNANVSNFLRAITHPDALLPLHVLSFFGHYGVPIFLFLSAYGLVMKYENGPQNHGVGWAPSCSFTIKSCLG